MALSQGTIDTLTKSTHQTFDPKFDIVPNTIVATAQVNGTPTTYPLGQISIKNATGFANVEVGHFVKITDSSDDPVTYGVVRKDSSAGTTLFIDGKALGDSGHSVDIRRPIQDNNNVTVYNFKPLWSLLSRINDGQFFKKFDIPYDGSGNNPYPVVNIGSWRMVKADSFTNLATLSYSASDSQSWEDNSLTYSWNLPVGATITSGSTTSTNITFTIAPGHYKVKITVTDSVTSATYTSTRYLWVLGDGYQSYNERNSNSFEILSDSEEAGAGREMTIKIWGEIQEEILLGSPFIFRDFATFDNVSISDEDILTETFVGYVDEITEVYEPGITGQKATEIVIRSPMRLFDLIPMVSQVIVEVASPTSWEEVSRDKGFGNASFVIWYILVHHTTYLEFFSYNLISNFGEYRKKSWGLEGDTVSQYLQQVASTFYGNVDTSSTGELYVREDPNYRNTAFRTANEERFTLTPENIIGEPNIATPRLGSVAIFQAYSLQYNIANNETNAFAAIAPGYQQGQSTGRDQKEDLVLRTSESALDRTKEIAGHAYARTNNPYSNLSFNVMRNLDIFKPERLWWYKIDLPTDYSPSNKQFLKRCTLNSVDRSWENNEGVWTKTITVSMAAETFGQPGQELEIPTVENVIVIEPPDIIEDYEDYSVTGITNTELPGTSSTSGGGTGSGNVILVTSNGYIWRTTNWSASSPTWESYTINSLTALNTGSIGLNNQGQFYPDPRSFGTGSANGWLLGEDGLFRLTDMQDTSVGTRERKFSVQGQRWSFDISRVDGSLGKTIIAHGREGNGQFRVRYSTDYGDTFSVQNAADYVETSEGIIVNYGTSGSSGVAVALSSDDPHAGMIIGLRTAGGVPRRFEKLDEGLNNVTVESNGSLTNGFQDYFYLDTDGLWYRRMSNPSNSVTTYAMQLFFGDDKRAIAGSRNDTTNSGAGFILPPSTVGLVRISSDTTLITQPVSPLYGIEANKPVDISPVFGGTYYGVGFNEVTKNAIAIKPSLDNNIVVACVHNISFSEYKLVYTKNATAASPTWSIIQNNTSYRNVYFSGNSVICIGVAGNVGYIPDINADNPTVISKKGDLPSNIGAAFIGIATW